MTPPNATSSTSAPPPPPLSHETLRERILTGGGTGSNARGSLSKVASRYADFIHSLMASGNNNNNNGNAGNGSSSSNTASTSTSASSVAASALQTELQLHDIEVRKLVSASRAADDDSARYSAALSRIRTSLSATQSEIESLAASLRNERNVKRRREEYDSLAGMGRNNNYSSRQQQLPPMRVTRSELERVRGEIDGVGREVGEARREANARERQMRALLSCLGDLKCVLGEKEEGVEKTRRKEEGVDDNGGDGVGGDVSTMLGNKKRKRTSDNGISDGSDSNDDIGAL